jgi:hypothetical protein
MNTMFAVLIRRRGLEFPPAGLPRLLAVLSVIASLAAPALRAQSPTVTGYNGTQTFVTSVGKDPDEPNACGVVGGSSYWFSYKPPTNGCVTFNTAGSSYDTVLAVYVDDGRNLGYASLLPVTCNDNISNTLRSAVSFTGSPKTNYYIMLDGVGGAVGTAVLNYKLNRQPTITTIAAQTITEDASTALLSFTVGDTEYGATNLTVVGISTNQNWVPNSKIVLAGTNASRTVKVTPGTNQWGTNFITLLVRDPGGASNTMSFKLQVSSVNDKPITFPDTVTRLPGKPITISRSFPPRNDTDADGDALTLSAVATKSVGGVVITLTATNFTYSPVSTYTNSDSFTYTISDGKGATATGTNFVNVSTNGVTIVY